MSGKQCPGCGAAARISAAFCADCGHRFRTRFVKPAAAPPPSAGLETDAVRTMMVSGGAAGSLRPVRGRRVVRRVFLGSLFAAGLTGVLLWAGWKAAGPAAPHVAVRSVRPLRAAAPVTAGQAEHLYGAIATAMSLYDLEETAGGQGRVVPGTDPHVLLLSYEYPNRSVRVLLNRADVTSDDYRVQTVSLYAGKTLLQRHTVVE